MPRLVGEVVCSAHGMSCQLRALIHKVAAGCPSARTGLIHIEAKEANRCCRRRRLAEDHHDVYLMNDTGNRLASRRLPEGQLHDAGRTNGRPCPQHCQSRHPSVPQPTHRRKLQFGVVVLSAAGHFAQHSPPQTMGVKALRTTCLSRTTLSSSGSWPPEPSSSRRLRSLSSGTAGTRSANCTARRSTPETSRAQLVVPVAVSLPQWRRGIAPIGFHADAGGSLRVPAGYCGIFALRPTPNAVILLTAPGVMTLLLENFTAVGPLAARARTRLAVTAVAGPDASVPMTAPSVLPSDYRSSTRPRIARIVDQTGAIADPDVVAEVDRVASLLREQEYQVVDVDLPSARRFPELWMELLGTRSSTTSCRPCARWRARVPRSTWTCSSGWKTSATTFRLSLPPRWSCARSSASSRSGWRTTRSFWRRSQAPVAPHCLRLLALDRSARDLFDRMRNVVMVNSMELPAVGLPNGVQLIGRRYHDHEAVQAAALLPTDWTR